MLVVTDRRFDVVSAVSETEKREAIPNSPQRHIVAGLAAVVGGLVAPYETASHIHDRPVLDWLWASGHQPFGPFSNTSSVSQLLLDTALVSINYLVLLLLCVLSFPARFCLCSFEVMLIMP
jgi:hypothetical protein